MIEKPETRNAESPSETLHQGNRELVRDAARRELLAAVEYERNYAPIEWFKPVALPEPETPERLRRIRDGKITRLKLTNRKTRWKEHKQLKAEIKELNSLLAQGKH